MKLAFYAFGNFRLQGIHAGIQMGHAACELFTTQNRLRYTETQMRLAQEWNDNHKVFVFLHAGQSADIKAAYDQHSDKLWEYPSTLFREEPGAFGDDATAKGAVTAWGIVLPESMYASQWVPPTEDQVFGHFRSAVTDGDRTTYFNWTEGTPQNEFLKYKSRFGLAR